MRHVSGYVLMYEGTEDPNAALLRMASSSVDSMTVALNSTNPDKTHEVLGAAKRVGANVIVTPTEGDKLDRCKAARAACVHDFMASAGTELFWLDDDVVPPAGVNMASRLVYAIDATDASMAAGLYRIAQGTVSLFTHNGRRWASLNLPLYTGEAIVSVQGAGFGCVVIPRALLQEVPYNHDQYGNDDLDYCMDVVSGGHRIAGIIDVLCGHGEGS